VNDAVTASIDLAVQQAINGQLGSSERLLWAGSPNLVHDRIPAAQRDFVSV
jgi:hypothetical protein